MVTRGGGSPSAARRNSNKPSGLNSNPAPPASPGSSNPSSPSRRRGGMSDRRKEDGCADKFGRLLVPLLILIAFLFNFMMVDVGKVSRKYDTILTPPDSAFLIWIIIYALEFAFVLYILFASKPRNSPLIQRKIAIPFIFHQILSAVWLVTFSRERIYGAFGLIVAVWLLTLLIFAQIAREFRTGRYENFSVLDYCLLEVPFAFLLGWETVAVILNANVLAVKVEIDRFSSPTVGHAPQIGAMIVSYSVITAGAILLAGLPMLMDPFCHLPIIWACVTIGMRCRNHPIRANTRHLVWVTREVSAGVKWASWTVGGIVAVFFLAAALILCSSGICMPNKYNSSDSESESADESTVKSEHGQGPRPEGINSPSSSAHRSPRTARSALSVERVV